MLRKEQTIGKDLETFRNQAAQFPEVQAQLVKAKAEVEGLKGHEVELEKVRKKLAEMEDYKAQLVRKGKEMEKLQAKNLASSQELATVTGKLFWFEQT